MISEVKSGDLYFHQNYLYLVYSEVYPDLKDELVSLRIQSTQGHNKIYPASKEWWRDKKAKYVGNICNLGEVLLKYIDPEKLDDR